MHNDIQILSRGLYLQLLVEMKLLDEAVIRSNEPEEVLTQNYAKLGNRFIIPWRKTKGKLRRIIMERQRSFEIGSDCHLKLNLCMKCPACLMFGGTGEVSHPKVSYNLLSRVMGDTFISTNQVEEISCYTANAVDEKTLSTGKALMSIVSVPVETVFRGVVTLRDPTPELAKILVDGLESVSRIGASTREWGRVNTTVLGCRLGDRETWSSYEFAEKPFDPTGIASLSLTNDVEAAYTVVKDQVALLLQSENLAQLTQTARGKGKKR
jgi:CRISPR type I-D-associated protein Csc2